MHPRSMFFTLFGVYIRHFGGEIWLSSLARLLGEFGFSDQSIRAAISRLQNQGWTATRKIGKNSYCSLTPKGLRRVDEAARRIYRLRREPWDGRWCLLTYTIPEEKRVIRDQLRSELAWWGFGPLSTSTWLSPHNLEEQMGELVRSYNLDPFVDCFYASYQGPQGNLNLARKCWDLEEVNLHYREFLSEIEPQYEQDRLAIIGNSLGDREAFRRRTRLVHQYRKFLFIDPALPEELLPGDWAGRRAVHLFYEYDQLLATGAGNFFSSLFMAAPDRKLDKDEIEQGLRAQMNPFSSASSQLLTTSRSSG